MLTSEFENAAEYGAFVDELYRDAEMDSFLARIGTEDSPLVIEPRSLATEIPLGRAGTRTHGSVIEVYLSRLEVRVVPRPRRSGVRLLTAPPTAGGCSSTPPPH
jgi:hypothetical protein